MASMRNGGASGGMDRRGQMQRVPANRSGVAEETGRPPTPSPLLNLARRIRDEQGVSGLRDFLAAMAPFAAPNELRSAAESFGMDYDSIRERADRERNAQPQNAYRAPAPQPAGFPQNGFGFDPSLLDMMQPPRPGRQNSGMDPKQLMQLMQLIPLLQGMKNGGGGPNIAQLMKLMGG